SQRRGSHRNALRRRWNARSRAAAPRRLRQDRDAVRHTLARARRRIRRPADDDRGRTDLDRTQTKLTTARIVFVLVTAAVFIVDRVTKNLVASQIEYGSEVAIVDHLVGITNLRNSGAAFGFAPAGAGLFLIASVLVAIGLAVYVLRNPGDQWRFGVLGLIMGGTVGHGFIRIVNGTVTGMLYILLWSFYYHVY